MTRTALGLGLLVAGPSGSRSSWRLRVSSRPRIRSVGPLLPRYDGGGGLTCVVSVNTAERKVHRLPTPCTRNDDQDTDALTLQRWHSAVARMREPLQFGNFGNFFKILRKLAKFCASCGPLLRCGFMP